MYRTTASRLRALKSHVGNLGATRYATSSAVSFRTSSPGFFSWLTGEQSSSLPPLSSPLGGVTLPPPLPDYVEPSKVKSKTLQNGVKVVSEASKNPAASIGLYLDCGSIYETPMSCGATHLLERMAFKSTRNRSHLHIVREVEAIGGNVAATASREQMAYTFDALRPEMVELLVDCVRNPVFLDWEVNEELKKLKDELGQLFDNPQGLLLEAIHSAGYGGALANPLLAPESALNRLDGAIWRNLYLNIIQLLGWFLQHLVLNLMSLYPLQSHFFLIFQVCNALKSQNLCILVGTIAAKLICR